MFGWLFRHKKEENEQIKSGFSSVKQDINNLGKWVEHLNGQDSKLEFSINDIKQDIASIKNDVEGLKNAVESIDKEMFKQLFKTGRHKFDKQTAVQAVQSAVQTPVQTGENLVFSNFSIMERALIWVLLNTELKLSYDDLAAMMGKSRATIRGQVNSIKQKSEGIVEEIIENNGKKRLFIPEEVKEKMLKNVKVRAYKPRKSSKRSEKELEYD